MTPSFERIGGFTSEIGAEISTFDSARKLLYVVSGNTTLQAIDLSDPAAPTLALSFDIAQFGAPLAGANSIAYKNNLVAVAFGATTKTDPGVVALVDLVAAEDLNAAGGNILEAVKVFTVGALPDMLTFTADGSQLLVANEGEAEVITNADGSVNVVDPEGSVSIIDVSGAFNSLGQQNVKTADFSRFNGKETDLRGDGVRIFPDATAAQDIEPEYIALSPDGTQAFVTLQENNAIALVDIASATVTGIQPLGLKDFSQAGNGLDASDRDSATNGGINIQPQPVFGLFMPDAIASFQSNGETFYLIANEGDDRGDASADTRGDTIRIKDIAKVTSFDRTGLSLDAALQQKLQADGLLADDKLGRLTISSIDGDTDGDGDIDQLVAYGGRSFSVLDSKGNLVFDSGEQLEKLTAQLTPTLFNANDGLASSVDTRSDNKGPEPEAITTGVIDGKPYAFVGLERAGGGVLMYDLSNPRSPQFVQYLRSDADIAPEGLTFIAAADSPNGQPLLAVANEVSKTVGIYQFSTTDGLTPIYDIQGARHASEFVSRAVVTTGIVTAVDTNGFYLQAAIGDNNTATSDALFVFTGSAPSAVVGDKLQVAGTVSEFTPGGVSTRNLSTTQISGNPTITLLSSGNALPTATILGAGGRVPPAVNIDDDAFASFDPVNDGLDFFESLEGMRVSAKDLLAVSGTNGFGEIFAVANQGAGASGLSDRKTLNISPNDLNPERIQINEDKGILPGFSLPSVNVGTSLGDVTGVVSYNFGNFEILPTEAFTAIANSAIAPESTTLKASNDQLTVATYNVLNLDPNEGDGDTDIADGRFDKIAQQIISNLGIPDIVGLQEIQDNSGSADDGTVAANVTLQKLVDAIAQAGGPAYQFIDNPFIGNNVSGGQPGGNIRTAFLYNPDRVSQVGEATTIGDQAAGSPFNNGRLPLVASFDFNGETITLVNNHLSSKGGSAPIFGTAQDFAARQEDTSVNGSLNERRAQAQLVNDFIDSILTVDSTLTTDASANVMVLGDLNEFEFVSPLKILEGTTVSADNGQTIAAGGAAVLTNLVNTLPENERYSYIFQGNSQSLDHVLVSNNLATKAEIDVVHVNSEFVENAQTASDHDPIVTRIQLSEPVMEPFKLQLLHLSDQEAGIPALDDAPRASAVLNALRDDYANTLVLSSGDSIIPGLFSTASTEAYGGPGRADILIQNELGLQAISFGNHEFDQGTAVVRDLVKGNAASGFAGAQYPYLSSNLNFATDPNLADLVVPDDQAPKPNSIAATTVIDINGEKVGIVGATTPLLRSISSPGTVGVSPAPFDGTPTAAQLDALAAEIQTDVDELLAANPGLNKVVLLSHMQQISIEQALATRLKNVDVIVAGGSNTRLFDADDRPRSGDSTQGEYPIFKTDADGKPIAIVNTDGNYKYIGRLVVDFDANGNVVPESYDAAVSGAYATDDAGVAALGAQGLVDPEIQTIVNNLEAVIVSKESNVFGVSDVYLNGLRDGVRRQETNLGNLTADANLAIAQQIDPSVVISLKNGGGIRDDIGQLIVPAGGTGAPEELPNEAIPGVKPAGGISENDIANSLRFNNGLSLVTVTAAELLSIVEYGVSATTSDDSATPGQFPQVAGIEFSFDAIAPANNRIQSLVVLDANGKDADVIVKNGELVGDATRTFRMVTLGFLATGGDGYTFPTRDVVNITQPVEAARTGVATFAADGSEQDALAEYLAANFGLNNGVSNPFNKADTARSEDTRIQNLAFRTDTVIDDGNGGGNGGEFIVGAPGDSSPLFGGDDNNFIAGRAGDSTLFGNGGDDTLKGDLEEPGGKDLLFGGNGNDLLLGGVGDDVLFGEVGEDTLFGEAGNDFLRGGFGTDLLFGGDGSDIYALAPGEGTDIILDFEAGKDFIGLSDGLYLGQLYVTQAGQNTVIGAHESGEVLAVVINANASQFNEQTFLTV